MCANPPAKLVKLLNTILTAYNKIIILLIEHHLASIQVQTAEKFFIVDTNRPNKSKDTPTLLKPHPVWGCRIRRLHLYRGVPPPTSVLNMTLNNLMVRLQ